jgi:MutS-like protein
VTGDYAARGAQHAARRDEELGRSALISRLRLATFLPAATCLLIGLSGRAPLPFVIAAIVLFTVFGALVVWHARVEERAAWYDALRLTNARAIARVERRWEDLPPGDAPAAVDLTHHPYALDLDLFGRASLFQWLGPAATPAGGTALAGWLLQGARPDDVRARQDAVAELATLKEWREQLAAHGILASGARQAEIDAFLSWAEGDASLASTGRPVLRVAVFVLTGSIWILLGLRLMGAVQGAFWMIPLLAGLVLSFAMARRIHLAFTRAGAGQQSLGRYGALFQHATAPRFSAPGLHALQERLSVGRVAAPACMRQLNRILGFAELRTGAALLHFPIQALTLWDFHVAFALERWRTHTGTQVRAWIEVIGDLDALSALAAARCDNPGWSVPAIDPEPLYKAKGLGHPLIREDRRVTNDVEIGPPATLLLVTGSNMSGKSTLLRAVGLNAVLAQAGGCACAAELSMPWADLQTSIRVQDSLELGLSYFMAALARLKGVVDAAEHPRPGRVLLYLLDEILQGTNSVERSVAVRAVARHLLDAGAIGAMTTHDLSVAGEEPLSTAARLVHFSEIVDDHGQMRFDYRLRDGLATSRNALRLMKMIGIDL